MEVRNFLIDKETIKEHAERRFIEICGFDLCNETHRRLLESCEPLRKRLWEKTEVRCATAFENQPVMEGANLQAGAAVVRCRYFQQIPREDVIGVHFYLVTLEHFDCDVEESTEAVYRDIWGTSIIDAVMESLPEHLCKDRAFLSSAMGPGYYGMDISEGRQIFSLLRGETAGVRITQSGVLIPEKSCIGFFLQYNRKDVKMQRACRQCLGQKGGCQFCVFGKKDEIK